MSAYVLANGQRVYPAFVLNDESGGGIVTPPASFRLSTGEQVLGIVLVDESGELAPAPGGGQVPYIETHALHEAIGTTALQANRAYLYHFRVQGELALGQVTIRVGTASGNVDVGVYSLSGDTLTRMASSGSTAIVGSSANQTIDLTATATCVPGTDYYLAVSPDNATATLGNTPSLNANVTALANRLISFSSSFPLPASFTRSSGTGPSQFPFMVAEP